MNYSRLDQWMHRLAFGASELQRNLSAIEELVYAERLRGIRLESPIFITSLPRAGTTAMLETMVRLPGIATHRYSDMPFVMAPILWNELSCKFRKNGNASRPRAHGDGISIGIDSPEAFEEVLWKDRWPDHYSARGIRLWSVAEDDPQFRDRLLMHMRKIAIARGPQNTRYLSKNNGNVGRLDLLFHLFPDAHVVVPFREPIDHANSLLRQHRNFLALHTESAFAERYMRDIGHFEFGSLHKPFLFPGFADDAARFTPRDIEYWLAYWIAAFSHVRKRSGKVILLPLEHFRRKPATMLKKLCTIAGIDAADGIDAAVSGVSPGRRLHGQSPGSSLERRAVRLYRDLEQISVRQFDAI